MNLIEKKLKLLPDAPGVYFFYNTQNEMVYVGKATSLKNRVKSYFVGQKTPRPIEEMIHEVADIKWVIAQSVLEAIILEANYIKKNQPKYNVLGKDDKSWNYIVITNDVYPKIKIVRERDLETQKLEIGNWKLEINTFGPYPGLNMREVMKILRRLFYISTCAPGQKRPCLYYEMGQCLGVCVGEISPKDYKNKVIKPLILFLRGNKKQLGKVLHKKMLQASAEENFEEAGRLRNQIKSLERIQDVALLNKSFVNSEEEGSFAPLWMTNGTKARNFRIEGYDISNLGTSDKVGSMVVFDESGPIKSAYRKFKIRTVTGQSDVDCLAEVLERRLRHNEWPLPDIFLMDGGLPQVNKATQILRSKGLEVPIIGIAKGPARKKNEFFIRASANEQFKAWFAENKLLLIQVRDEAHRFAITFHRSRRKIV